MHSQLEARTGPLSSIRELQDLNEKFEADRPLLAARNRNRIDFQRTMAGYELPRVVSEAEIDLSHYKKLLLGEIEEFNGVAETGYFSEFKNREDNRQQEVSDMVLFALTYYTGLGLDEHNCPYEPNEPAIQGLVRELLTDYEIKEIGPSTSPGRVENFNPGDEQKFEALKAELNYQGSLLEQTKTAHLSRREKRQIIKIIEQILSLSFAIFHLMGKNPIRQVGEKILRNYLRHPAYLLSITQVPKIDPETPADERRKIISDVYRRQAIKIQDLWDGPLDAEKKRPGTGTNDFYSEGAYT